MTTNPKTRNSMKTKNRKEWLAVLIGILLLTGGCNDETSRQPGFAGVPLNVGGMRLDAGIVTRSEGIPVTGEGASIGVFLTGEGGYTPAYNKTYTCSGGNWSSTDPVFVDNRTGKVLGLYDPHGLVSFGANTTVTANPLRTLFFDENALWYYDNTTGAGVNNTNSVLEFNMKCAYSRLSLGIARNVTYPFACKISRIVINPSAGSFYTEALVDIADGSLTGTTAASYDMDTSGMPMNTTGLVPGFPDTSIDLLFPAQALEAGAGLTFTLTTDGNDHSVTVPAATLNTLQAGVRYMVQLEMAATGLAVGSVTTADWVPVDSNIHSQFD